MVLAIAAVGADARLLVLLGLDLVGQSNWCEAQQLEGAVEILDHSDLQMMGRQTEGGKGQKSMGVRDENSLNMMNEKDRRVVVGGRESSGREQAPRRPPSAAK